MMCKKYGKHAINLLLEAIFNRYYPGTCHYGIEAVKIYPGYYEEGQLK